MSETRPFTLPIPSGAALDGLVDLPDLPGERPTVVVCHGFKGFMEWGFFPYLATLLAERGFVVVRLNLSGSGMRPGEDAVADPQAFRDNTYSRERDDLLAVLAATGTEIAAGRVDRARLGLFGHSRGGGDSILVAGNPPWRDRVRALVTWASIATVDRFSDGQKEEWRRSGEMPAVNARTGQALAMGLEMLRDIEANREALDIPAAAGRVAAPWLIVHGTADESVRPEEARRLDELATTRHELLVIPGAHHTFGSQHPFVGPTPDLIQALNATQSWFRRYL